MSKELPVLSACVVRGVFMGGGGGGGGFAQNLIESAEAKRKSLSLSGTESQSRFCISYIRGIDAGFRKIPGPETFRGCAITFCL